MAGIDIITTARGELEEKLLDLALTVEMCDAIAGDKPPAWLSILSRQVARVRDSSDSYMQAVHRHATPVLLDLARATAGGMGGMPPMVAKRSVAETPGSRLSESNSRK